MLFFSVSFYFVHIFTFAYLKKEGMRECLALIPWAAAAALSNRENEIHHV